MNSYLSRFEKYATANKWDPTLWAAYLQDKEGVCYFLKSRLAKAPGTVDGQNVVVLRDTGCTGVAVRRNMISHDQLTGKESAVTLKSETTQRHPLAVINVDCPFLKGQSEALCMDSTLCDLIIGNIDGS